MDANTGQSSGGHSALRFEDTVFHFQHYPDEIFRAVREPYDLFSYSYNIFSNRTSKIARIALSEKQYDKIQDGFDRVSVIQFKHLSNLESLRTDRKFFHQISHPERKVKIRSLGYFSPKSSSLWSSKIREEMETRLGKNWLGSLRSRLKAELDTALAENRFETSSVLPLVAKGKYPFYKNGPSSWFHSRIEKLAALEILSGGFGLSEESIFPSASGALSDDEESKLRFLQESLFQNCIHLLEKNEADWGKTFLVNLARIQVLEKSFESNRAYFLVSFPEQTESISYRTLSENRDSIRNDVEILLQAAKDLRENFGIADAISEEKYGLWEDLENRDWELRTGLSRGISIRNTFERLSPNLPGDWVYSFPIPDKEKLARYSKIAEKRENEYYESLKKFYFFQLVRRNCTTEIFEVIGETLSEEEYRAALGERIIPSRSISFIPFAGYDSIVEKWNPEEEKTELSYRKESLQKMREKENALLVFLRESNTLSSEIYRSNSEDSSFLFFTDDIVLTRPVYGIFNLGWSIGNFGLGIFTLPFDKGKRLEDGLNSALFSFPELFFFNVRKGSFPNAAPRKRNESQDSKPNQ